MRGELVRIEAEDGLELVGYYVAPEGRAVRRAVLHTHGYAGNFYENRFVDAIGEAVLRKGLAFLTYNNRGHDYRSDNIRGEGVETTSHLGGGSFEVFEECVLDVGGAAAFLEARGHAGIYFCGHSLGTNKVVHYLASRGDRRALGAILISPPDIFGLREVRTKGRIGAILDQARALVRDGRSDALIDDPAFVVPMSAATLVSAYGDPAVTDVFPFRLGEDGDYGRLASIGVPVLATLGNVDEAITVSAEAAVGLLERCGAGSPGVRAVVVEGANHVYWGREQELAGLVGDFVLP
jgi:pimeloyl-ACP methyl ester carboxylesterase